jgi:hypothetical protein
MSDNRDDEVREMHAQDLGAAEAEGQPRRSVAAQLVDLTLADYTLGISDTDEPFAVSKARPHIALPLRGGKTGYRPELARRYFDAHNSVPGAQALTDACTVLEGKASQCNPVSLNLRVAEANGVAYVDTGDTDARVIRITGGNWEVVDAAPVLFRRTKLTGAMVAPVRGGRLADLWRFALIAEADRPVVLAVLVHALIQPDTPHPILALLAEQGLTKSSTTRVLVDLIDPSPVPLRQAPRDAESWSTAAAASWVVALDNLSGIPAWLSDCLCRAATGDGNVKRALYTDGDVAVTRFRRCVILNGIDVGASAGDLAERMALADLTRLKAGQRQTEAALAAAWEQARPGILGALLTLAAKVHRRLPSTTLDDAPRMADFARILAAVDAELGTAGLARYRQRAGRMAADSLTADEFIGALLVRRYECDGMKAGDVLAALTPEGKEWRRPKDWPRSARAVTGLLRRHAPALRQTGWTVNDDGGHNKDGVTRWTLTPPPAEQSGNPDPPDPPNPPSQVSGAFSGGESGGVDHPRNPANPRAGYGREPAGNVETDTPPESNPLTRGNGSAGQAGQKYASAPLAPGEQSVVHAPPAKSGTAPPAATCPECGYPITPDMADNGMHPDCARIVAAISERTSA